jgi:hypothetical protein
MCGRNVLCSPAGNRLRTRAPAGDAHGAPTTRADGGHCGSTVQAARPKDLRREMTILALLSLFPSYMTELVDYWAFWSIS